MKTKPPRANDVALRTERLRQLRGLFYLVIVILIFTVYRAHFHRVFTLRWWHP